MENFIARQAIFDTNQKVVFYSLTIQNNLSKKTERKVINEEATAEALNNIFTENDAEAYTGGKKALVSFSRYLILQGIPKMFPSEKLAVRITKDIMDNAVFEKLNELRRLKYTVVMENVQTKLNFFVLKKIADIVSFEFINKTQSEIELFLTTAKNNGLKCMATNIDSYKQFNEAKKSGFEYFQGKFFTKPNVVAGEEIPAFRAIYGQILTELNKQNIDYNNLEQIIKKDTSISYRLLKMINSAAIGTRIEVKSIKQALSLLGTNESKRWLTVIIMGNIGSDKPDELMRSSLFRAKLAELLAPHIGKANKSDDLFLTGLFSLIHVFIPRPLEEILDSIPLGDDIKGALKGSPGYLRSVLDLVVSYEAGDWDISADTFETLNIDQAIIPDLFKQTLRWVMDVFQGYIV